GALAVGPLHGEAEGALAEAGADELLGAVARTGVRGTEERGGLRFAGVPDDGDARAEGGGALEAGLPDPPPLPLRWIVAGAGDGVVGPVGGAGNPELLGEEDGGGEEVAADDVAGAVVLWREPPGEPGDAAPNGRR